MNFDLKKPCAQCPFRTDVEPYLRTERVEELCDAIVRHDKTFQCHKTLTHDDEGRALPTDKDQHCAGALIMLEHMRRPNQMMRIAYRLGFYDKRKLDMSAPVYMQARDMIDAHAAHNGD
ncbi:DUF6283 family protein [Paraburkholderia sp. C35]|uniref:DUF6283 family protein n=1 Tax=Paraburkholderia sp. C35 TaxID=2126993 RepID=UPI000D6922E2|nr:DUF6283 family protein [Paraburkholderia sp. C35]